MGSGDRGPVCGSVPGCPKSLPLPALPQNKSDADMARAGGLAGVASALRTDLHQGCNLEGPTGLAARREAYGSNVFKPVPAKNFFVLWYSVLKVLMGAAGNTRFEYIPPWMCWPKVLSRRRGRKASGLAEAECMYNHEPTLPTLLAAGPDADHAHGCSAGEWQFVTCLHAGLVFPWPEWHNGALGQSRCRALHEPFARHLSTHIGPQCAGPAPANL